MGRDLQDLGLVFTREDGSAIYPDGWTGTFERHIRQAGLPKVRLHDQHTHASLLLAAGVNPKIVSERLGHHSTAFTPTPTRTSSPGHAAQGGAGPADVVMAAVDEPVEPPAAREGG